MTTEPEDTLDFRIESIYAYLSIDPEDGDEGICAFKSGMGWMPMVAADMKRLESLRPIAEKTAKASGQQIRLVQFIRVREIEVITP